MVKRMAADGGDLRFPKERRLLASAEFRRVTRRGRKRLSGLFVLYAAPRQGTEADGPARLGITASKKVGGAVIRNRIKRICRETFRRMKTPPGLDLVLIARSHAAKRTNGELARDLEKLLEGLG